MADTPLDTIPPLTWLKGDEVVLLPDGSLKREAELFDSTPTSRPGHARQAIAIWPNGTTPAPEDLAVFGSDAFNDRVLGNLRDRGQRNAQYYKTLEQAGYIWGISSTSGEDDAAQAFAKDAGTAAQSTLHTISRSPQEWLANEAVHHAFTEMPLRAGRPISDYCINDVRFRNSQQLFTGQPVFTREFAEFLSYDNLPITITPKDFLARPNTDFLISAANGLVLFNNRLIRAKAQGDYEINHLVSQALVLMAGTSIGLTNQTLGIPDERAMKSIRQEFTQHRDLVMNEQQKVDDDSIPIPDPAILIISQLHFALHSGLYNPLRIRQEMPQSVALYERFMDIVKEHVNERKASPTHNALRYQEGIALSPAPTQDETRAEPPPPPPPPPALPDFGKHLFTANPNESALVESVHPMMANALDAMPPCNQFRCRLVLDDNNSRNNYPINLTFRNDRGQTMEYTVFTGTGDLDEAIELKKIIQSHILNHESMTALYMNVGGSDSRRTTATDAFIPDELPTTTELIKSGRRYEARMVFAEGTDAEREFIIPLGLLDNPRNTSVEAEALRRLDRIDDYLLLYNEAGLRLNLGDIIRDLKRDVAQQQGLGWTAADRQKLDYYGEGAIDVPFPSAPDQHMTLSSATLFLEEGASHPNPTWKLHYEVKISGLGADGTETKECKLSQNLHTSDELAAQVRGSEAIEFLFREMQRLGQSHPGLHWEYQDHAPEPLEDGANTETHGRGFVSSRLALRLPDGGMPADPEPQNLLHVSQDMPNPKTNFKVDYVKHTKDEDTLLTLNVQRGTEAEGDLIQFKDLAGRDLARTFRVDSATSDGEIAALVQQLNSTFGSYIQDAYGNRTDEGARKPRQVFQTATIRNLFHKTVAHHLTGPSAQKGDWIGDEIERPAERGSGRGAARQ